MMHDIYEGLRRAAAGGDDASRARAEAIALLGGMRLRLARWTAALDSNYRTLTNSAGERALPAFTSDEELETAATRLGWVGPHGDTPSVTIDARAVARAALAEQMHFIIIDIAATHSIELTPDEMEVLAGGSGPNAAPPGSRRGESGASRPSDRPASGSSRVPSGSSRVPSGSSRMPSGSTRPSQRPLSGNEPPPPPTRLTSGSHRPPDRPTFSSEPPPPPTRLTSGSYRPPDRPISGSLTPPSRSRMASGSLDMPSAPNGLGSHSSLPPAPAGTNPRGVSTIPPDQLSRLTLFDIERALSDELSADLTRLLRGYPEVEWAVHCFVSRGSEHAEDAIALGIDKGYRDRMEEIRAQVTAVAQKRGAAIPAFVVDDRKLAERIREKGEIFFPWKR